ncbi:SRPBCC family protein [Cytobacillus kochii]
MPVIKHRLLIHADIHLCFDLARNVEVHTETTKQSQERAVAGVTSGLLRSGDTVTWEAIHFGVKQRLTAEVTEMERPYQFTDVSVKGAFQSFIHVHEFREHEEGTEMIDSFSYISPLGLIGKIADFLFLKAYTQRFITKRAIALKKMAEGKS